MYCQAGFHILDICLALVHYNKKSKYKIYNKSSIWWSGPPNM